MKLIDADVLLSQMDNRYIEKENSVSNTLAEGFMQMDKLINQQDVFDLSKHDSDLLDKVAEKFILWDSKVKGIREDGVCFFTIENILKGIEDLKAEVSK